MAYDFWLILLHRRFRHHDPQFPELSHHAGRAPGWIGLSHLANQITHLLGDGETARLALLAEMPPVLTEALALPADFRGAKFCNNLG